MGWFKDHPEDKPKVDHIYFADIAPDSNDKYKLAGEHPILIKDHNNDSSARYVGLTSNPDDKGKRGPKMKIETDPQLSKDSYAKLRDGERDINNDKIDKWKDKGKVTESKAINTDDVKKKARWFS